MISSGAGVRCPSDGRKPKRVAILLCVGSRDRQIGREWCSKICCTVSCQSWRWKSAKNCRIATSTSTTWISAHSGSTKTGYYWRSQEEFKVKYIKARIAEVTSDGDKLIVKGEDTLVKRPITIPFDMVVHAIGMDPNVDNLLLSTVFDVALEPHGFIGKQNSYGDLGATSRPGVFVAGSATGPETIDDSIAQGHAAAMSAYALAQGAGKIAAE